MIAIQPSIEIFGVKVLEPVTTLTDLLVSAVCYYAFFKLSPHLMRGEVGERPPSYFIYFKYFFLTMGIATTIGGLIGHAFIYAFTFGWKVPGWIMSMLSVALIERSAILHAQPLMKRSIGKFFAVLNLVELITFIFISIFTLNFLFVEIHATYGLMLVVFSFELFVFIKTKDKGSRYILLAVALAALSAIIHLNKISLHQWFNFNDISHVLMAISAWLFYKGALLIKNAELRM